jgi:hypothetical protein
MTTTVQPDIEKLLLAEHARTAPKKRLPELAATVRKFGALGEDRYRLVVSEWGVTLDVDRLRRERNQLVGELSVECALPEARAVEGRVSRADLSLSSAPARLDRAKYCATRVKAEGLDWPGLMEEFCQMVLAADRDGNPAVDLRNVPLPPAENALRVEGIDLVMRHPTILFGDGGACKSYIGLWIAGRLVERGIQVIYFDWELDAADHRFRLGMLFPDGMPQIHYVRCGKPLTYEVDHLRRVAREVGAEYAIYDSVVFACDGPPEDSEVASRYFRAVRQIGVGSLHIAHVSKAEGADQKPFGSAFWHNGARSSWYVQSSEVDPITKELGLHHRKANLGRLQQPVGLRLRFDEDRVVVTPTRVAANADLAEKLSVKQRMSDILRGGAMTIDELAAECQSTADTIKRTSGKWKGTFVTLSGDRVGLVGRQ